MAPASHRAHSHPNSMEADRFRINLKVSVEYQVEICRKHGRSMICEQGLTLAPSWPCALHISPQRLAGPWASAEAGQVGLKTGKKREQINFSS